MIDAAEQALLDRLTSDPAICGGAVCIKGTRIPVAVIRGALAGGDSIEDVLRGYPSITRQDVSTALAYAARLAEERIVPLPHSS